MPDTTEHGESDYRNPLLDYSDRWYLDADLVRCRSCKRGQHVSYAHRDFPHASHCPNADAERNPWKTLLSLINAQVMQAKQP